jgi:hypothetical protein
MILSDVSNIKKRSTELIDVQCDSCDELFNIKYVNYHRNGNKDGFYTCKTCKTKNTNLEKWGVENPSQLDSIKEKKRDTFTKNWGVDHPSKSDIIKEKKRETFQDRFGVDNPFESEEVKEKIKITNIIKFSVENPSQSEEIKEKKRETLLKNWGVDHPLKSKEIKSKRRETFLENWGESNHTKSEKFRKRKFNVTNESGYIRYISNRNSKYKCTKGHIFEIKSGTFSDRKRYNIPICTVCNPIGDLKSIKEKELFEFIKSIYDREIIQSWRNGLEIDIYLPHLNLGFEFNGLYYHSDKYKDKWYHLNKTKHFEKRGIRIIHIWEDDWINRCDIIKSQITNLLNKSERKIFARKCYVKEIVDSKISTKFLEDNHIQGKDYSKVKLGLFFNGELVSVMAFNKSEGRKKMEEGGWNLSRFCNKINLNVVGGASKLLNFFIKNYDVRRIVSYADRDWSIGDLYFKLGFDLVSENNPDYKYIVENKRIHKSRFRKFKTGLSERELNLLKVWDCGKLKFMLVSD